MDDLDKFKAGVQKMINELGEEFARNYLQVYCEIMLEDPELDVETKRQVEAALEFLKKDLN
jgi:hypothetical protein